MPHLGTPELIIILVIILVLFGAGRISRIAGELGQGIREFRKGLSGTDKPTPGPKDRSDEPSDKTG